MLSDNIFLKIVEKKIPARIVHEDEHCLAFHDINPQAPVHVLIIPRKVIPTHADIKTEDREMLGHLHLVAASWRRNSASAMAIGWCSIARNAPAKRCRTCTCTCLAAAILTWPPG